MKLHVELKKFDAPLPPRRASDEVRTLLTRMLEKAGLPTDPPILRDENGRPYIAHASGAPKFDFNFSHAGRYVVCALAIAENADEEPRVGVDVEVPRPHVKKERLAQRFFSDGERQVLEKAAFDDREFLRIWTKKEAYLKFVGTGLSGGLREADTTRPDVLGVVFTEYTVDGAPDAVVTLCVKKSVSAGANPTCLERIVEEPSPPRSSAPPP